MLVTLDYITVKDHKIKMPVDSGADRTVISSLISTELGTPQLNGTIRHLGAYDGHQLTFLGSLTCDVEWNGSKYRQEQLAVVQSDKKFGLLGRDILPQEGINAVSDERLLAVKRIKSGIWKQCSEAEKGFEQQEDALTILSGINFRGVVPFIPPKLRPMVIDEAHETHPGKNATETAVRMMAWWPGISQDVHRYVSKCKENQENRPSLGKIVSTWLEAEVWERLHMDWGYVKDQGNILVIVDAGSGWIEAFPLGNRTSKK